MPLFSISSFDPIVEKATSEMNTSEDWSTIMEICDKVEISPNGSKECLQSIMKRLNSNVPHHAMHALTLLDACVKNNGKKFHLEVSSKDFETLVKKLLQKGHPKVVDKLKGLLKKWSEEDFKNDPELSLIPSLYNSIKTVETVSPEATSHKSKSTRKDCSVRTDKEDEDLAKAIELSLKETGMNTLYPTVSTSSVNLGSTSKPKESIRKKVKALYDFEAVEENELSFKAGELIFVIDSSDANWWKGETNHGDVGLFPANFATSNLSEPEETKKKSVKFCEDVRVLDVLSETLPEEGNAVEVLDENSIDKMLFLLHEADPNGERPDCEELLSLESQGASYTTMINMELEKVDRSLTALTSANQKLVQALQTYETLMKDCLPPSLYQHTHTYTQDVPIHGYQLPPRPDQHAFTMREPIHNYHPAETYQPMPAPSNNEHFPVPPIGALPTNQQSHMMQNGTHSQVPYAVNPSSYANMPQNNIAVTSGQFPGSLPTRETNGMFYGDFVPNAIQHNPTPVSMQQQPML